MLDVVDYPELADRTGRFRRGAPHAVAIGRDGARVAFLRSAGPFDAGAGLWVLNVASATERLAFAGPVGSFSIDRYARTAAAAVDGRLVRVDLVDPQVTEIATAEPVEEPQLDPTGKHIGYVTADARLRVVTADGTDQLLAGEKGGPARWGVPDPVATEFGRARGWWWAPDGTQILAARIQAARSAGSVSLHLLDLDDGWVDVHWDRETYPYLVDARWDEGGALITVLRRMQQHGLVLAVDRRTGETQVHAELADARWVEPVPGTPRHLPDGRVLVGGELAHDGFDARCLFADGSLLTPPSLYVRRVVGVLPRPNAQAAAADLIVEGTEGAPAEQHVYRIRTSLSGGAAQAVPLTVTPGWHEATVGGDVIVLDRQVWRGEAPVHLLASHAAPLPSSPEPILDRVTDRRLPTALLYPAAHLVGRKLPVLVTFGDGPGHQQVTLAAADFQERQWWPDAGFAVVSVDSRGTPGITPSFEKVVHRRLVDVALTDHVDALLALVGKHPDLDLSRIAVRGTGLGGWLAALAVLRRPDIFRCAVARDPVTDWATLPTPFAERYLGRLADSPDVYAHHNLLDEPTSESVLTLGADAPLDQELDFLRRTIDRLERP